MPVLHEAIIINPSRGIGRWLTTIDPSPEVDDLRTAAKDGAPSGLFARFFEVPPERISNRTEPLADTSLDTRHFPRISPLSDERPRTESEQESTGTAPTTRARRWSAAWHTAAA